MHCRVCGGTESYIEDGIEYCRDCSLQVQSSRDEKSAEESFSRRTLQSTPDISKSKKERRKKFSPWISTEAYNLILMKQVSVLIKLGCSKKLKDVVLYIWAKYLQKCETAFIKENFYGKNTPRLSIAAEKRDKQLLYGDGYVKGNKKKRKKDLNGKATTRSRKNRSDKVIKVLKTEVVSDSESEITLQNTIFDPKLKIEYSSDSNISDTIQGGFSDSSACISQKDVKKKKVLYSSHARRLMKAGKRRIESKAPNKCIHRMTLNKTLSFCHLGLLYTEDQLLLRDLIRLVNDGTVPYIDVTRHFPPSMQLQNEDYMHFNKFVSPDISTIALNSVKLIHFLKLPKFKPSPILPIAVRFVKDLNLPNDIIPVLKVLKNKLPERKIDKWFDALTKKKSNIFNMPIYEVQAVSLIAVALKMLFVLDGKFEEEHSEIMVKLNSIAKENKFFVWNEWQKQTTLKEYIFMKKGVVYNDMSRLDSLSVDRIIEGYPLYSTRPELHQLIDSYCIKDIKARYQTKILLDGLIGDNKPKIKATSFPLQYEIHKLMTEWKGMHLFKETSDIDFDFIGKDFSHHKLLYKPSAFSSDRLKHLLLSSLYESVKLYYIHFDQDRYNRWENMIRTSTKYWYLDDVTRNTSSDFNRHYIKKNWMDDLPYSFKWLFKFLCKYLSIEPLELCWEIIYIEKKLFVL